jgi:hypothetical protein
MPRVRFEPRIPVFEQAKTVHAVERAATVIGDECTTTFYFAKISFNNIPPPTYV